MKKSLLLKLPLLTLALLVWLGTSVQAQKMQFLPSPDEFKPSGKNEISKGPDGPAPGNILLGAVPPNTDNKPVLVFIHGYTGSAFTWLPEGDNDMYFRAFNAGYRTAFVTVYPDRTMWDNGALFSNQLAAITNYYGVNKVVIVAHSKGGLDSDAALIHYGGVQYANRVITLGSPHFGSPLADLAQSGWVSWLSAVFGQANDATYVMQLGYMSYFRSITDGHPNAPLTDFRTVGAWGYSGSLWFSGVYLNAAGYGRRNEGNDGVVAYVHARRPNSWELYSGHGDSRTDYNHFELSEGPAMWGTIQSQLPSSLSRNQEAGRQVVANYNPNSTIGSNSLVLVSNGGAVRFPVGTSVNSFSVDVRQMDKNSTVSLMGGQGKDATSARSGLREAQDGMLGKYVEQLRVDNPVQGTYTLEGGAPFVAVVNFESKAQATLHTGLEGLKRVYNAGEAATFTVSLTDNNGLPLSGANVEGVLRYTSNLKGVASAIERTSNLTFTAVPGQAGVYQVQTQNLELEGIYNISVKASAGNFERTVIGSVAVAAPANNDLQEGLQVSNYPNPFSSNTNIIFTLPVQGQASLVITDLMGRTVQRFDLSHLPAGQHSIAFGANTGRALKSGTYLYQLNAAGTKRTGKMTLMK